MTLPGVLRGEQCMDAAAGADVEGPVDARARCQRVEDARRRRVGRHVIGRVILVLRVPVRREQHLADRQDPSARNDPFPDLREPDRLERSDGFPAERSLGVLGRNGQLQEEQAYERRERPVGQPAFLGAGVAAFDRVRVLAEQAVNGVVRVAGPPERRPESFRCDGVGYEISVHHQSGIIMPEPHAQHVQSRG